ncbi:hypothetical protein [Mycobacterium sp. UM_Kg27]|nr:hypothetical protein [Mycobacterium sp. UM_Kg27]
MPSTLPLIPEKDLTPASPHVLSGDEMVVRNMACAVGEDGRLPIARVWG